MHKVRGSTYRPIASCVFRSLRRLSFTSILRMPIRVIRLHTSYRPLLGSINWLQSSTQFQACYQFSRLASASAAPTVGHCKEFNKLRRQIRSEEVELRVWPVKGSPRIFGIPDAAFRNNSDKSSQRAMTIIFIADARVENRRDARGSPAFFESTKIKRTTLSATVAELDALMKCFGTCQMLCGRILAVWMPRFICEPTLTISFLLLLPLTHPSSRKPST